MKDAIVIGGGPAALTAALYLGRYERETVLLTDSFGGQAATAGKIENYPGHMVINGYELIAEMKNQVANFKQVEIIEGERVAGVDSINNGFHVKTKNDEYEARSVIIASGRQPRRLGLPNEEGLIGRGISYCATCDGPFARDKDVVIVGGGYAATEAALILTKVAKSITMIDIAPKIIGETVTLDKVKNDPRIKTIGNGKVTEIVTGKGIATAIESVKYQDTKTGETREVSAQFIFIEIGQQPSSDIFSGFVDLDEKTKEIKINHQTNQTSREGVYAAGDITNILAKQIIVACGEGAKAAIAANKYLNKS